MKNWTAEDIVKIQKIMYETDVVSLNTIIGDGESPESVGESELGDFIVDKNNPFENLEKQLNREYVLTLISKLNNPRAEKILRLRYGLDGGECLTLDEIGKMYNVTRERIRQVVDNALITLRRLVRENNLSYDDFVGG